MPSLGDLEDPLLPLPDAQISSIGQQQAANGEDSGVGSAVVGSMNSERVGGRGCSTQEATFNLAITAVGAGVLALPRAFSSVGLVLGLLVAASVCLLTYCSTRVIVSAAASSKLGTYGAIVEARIGRLGATLLQLSIIIHVAGAMCVYLLIIADVLVGVAPDYHGVLPELIGVHTCPWWLSRDFVLLVLVVLVEVPLFSLRSMAPLSKAAGACVASTFFLAAVILALAATAASQGKLAADTVIWPGSGEDGGAQQLWGGSALVAAREVAGSVAVAALAYTCHFNVVPVQRSLRDQSDVGAMYRVIRGSVIICCLLYSAVGAAGYLMFGSATKGDVLQNLNLRYVSGLIGKPAAHVVVACIGISYPVNLLVNFALRIWGLRENLAGLLLRKDAAHLSRSGFYVITYASLAAVYCVSVVVPSVWFVVEVIGSTACMIFAYIVPALLLILGKRSGQRVGGAALLAIGLTVAVVGTYNALAGAGDKT